MRQETQGPVPVVAHKKEPARAAFRQSDCRGTYLKPCFCVVLW